MQKEKIAKVPRSRLEEEKKKIEKFPESSLQDVENAECPACGEPSWGYSDDLVYEAFRNGERIVTANLTGLRCRNCGDKAYDTKSSMAMEEALEEKVPGGYECSITTLGGERLEFTCQKTW